MIIGCSSYNNRLWVGPFYPPDLPAKSWFAYYCAHFNTYELNSTFYNFPTARSLHAWYQKSPDGFLFSVKAPKLITHNKKLVGCEREIAEFYAACRDGLQDKLGYALFQFPPSFHYSRERLDLIVTQLRSDIQLVIEFRHESWWNEEVYRAFIQHNLIFCSVNHPLLPTAIIATATTGYLRLHGNPTLFYSEYSNDELKHLYDEIRGTKNLHKMLVYFNNTASEAGIVNALTMKHLAASSD